MLIPEIVPVSDMANRQQAVLAMSDEAPVVLAQRSKARAVLVSIEEWNRREQELKLYRDFWLQEARRLDAENSASSDSTLQDVLAEVKDAHGIDLES